jgi:hypothetical protein
LLRERIHSYSDTGSSYATVSIDEKFNQTMSGRQSDSNLTSVDTDEFRSAGFFGHEDTGFYDDF